MSERKLVTDCVVRFDVNENLLEMNLIEMMQEFHDHVVCMEHLGKGEVGQYPVVPVLRK